MVPTAKDGVSTVKLRLLETIQWLMNLQGINKNVSGWFPTTTKGSPVTTIKRKGHCHELLPLSAPLSYFSPEKRIFRSFPSTVSHPTTGNQPVTSDQPTTDEKTSTISQPAIYPHQPLSQAQISPTLGPSQSASFPASAASNFWFISCCLASHCSCWLWRRCWVSHSTFATACTHR